MAKLQRANGAGNGKKDLQPYYVWGGDPATRRALLSRMVGFDIGETLARLYRWLARSQYGATDKSGNLSVSVPAASPNEQTEATKAREIRNIELALYSFESMHGPERAAGKRWHDALAELRTALDRFVAHAAIRTQEESYFLSRVHGDRSRGKATAALTARTERLASALSVKARAAQSRIVTYVDDSLPKPGTSGRPNRTWLGRAEARLSLAGFKPSEIANLIVDNERVVERGGPAAQKKHRRRIESRIKVQKGRLVRERRDAERADASLAAFIDRTGAGQDDLELWFDSPEYRALSETSDEEKL